MFYGLSKLFWFTLAPSHLAIWLGVAAAILIVCQRARAALWCAIASSVLLIGFGFSPLGVWLMAPIENAYPRAALPDRIDGILILGGGSDGEIFHAHNAPLASYGLPRLVAAYQLARRYPSAKVVFSGGPFDADPAIRESTAAKAILIGLGLEPSRLILENRSRNTWENFRFSQDIVHPAPGEHWVVVTSAFHMPRTMAIAKRVGWTVLPWPADYLTASGSHYSSVELPQNLERSDLAIHEGIGLLAYRLTGKAH